MAAEQTWVPFRWPSLDGFWQGTAAIDLLKDTPFNCLVLGTKQTMPPEVREAARQRSWPVLALGGNTDPVLVLNRSLWPEIRLGQSGEGSVSAGPTGEPWVDSNGWRIRLAQAQTPGKQIWVACEPPKRRVLKTEAYQVAVADAASVGGRWIVTLDDDLAKRLADGDASARATWRGVADAVRFFSVKPEWTNYQPAASLAVVSDFAGEHGNAWADTLNLLGRRHLPYRILTENQAAESNWAGITTILFLSDQPPRPNLLKRLPEFIRKGGLLITMTGWNGLPDEGVSCPVPEFACTGTGRGRAAVAHHLLTDPYLIAADTHLLMSRRQDPYRLWNAIGMGSSYRVSPDGRRAIVQIINYTGNAAGHPVTLQTAKPYRAAQLVTLSSGDPQSLPIHAAERGIEAPLPPFPAYSAVELTA